MPKSVFIEEERMLLWLPDDPKFNQWVGKKIHDYGIPWDTLQESLYILINWSNRPNTYAFQIAMCNPLDSPLQFYTSSAWKHLKAQMDGITMKSDHVMIERAEDVVMFRMLYGDSFK